MTRPRKSPPAPQQRARSPDPRPLRGRTAAGVALIALATVVAYLPAVHGDFILDDNLLLTDSALIRAPDGIFRFWFTTEHVDYWPVANTSLWIEWRLWGIDPTGYHVTNLLLHIATVFLVWRLLRLLAIPGAFAAALLFAIHPVNVETVAWIAQRKSLLALLFFLLSILFYLRAEAPPSDTSRSAGRRWYALSLLAFALALLSKVSAAMLPAVLLLIVWWRRPLTSRDLLRTLPYALLAAVLGWVNVWFQTHARETPIATTGFTERLLGAGAVVWFYLSKALLPLDLVFVYPQWHVRADQLRWWVPLLAALTTTGVLWRYRHGWGRAPFFAWGGFCLALLPVMGFVDVGYGQPLLVADHYQHAALIAIVALLAAGWSLWWRRSEGVARWAAGAAAIVVVGALMFLTREQSRLYAGPMTLYAHTVERNPASWIAQHDLGLALFKAGRIEEATGRYREAVRLKPDEPQFAYDLGTALARTGRSDEALPAFQQALRLAPDYADAHNNLGNALLETGRPQDAIEHYESALRLSPDFVDANYNLARALLQLERAQQAIGHLERVLQVRPDDVPALSALGAALLKTGRREEAIRQFEHVVRLEPDDLVARHNLAEAAATGVPTPGIEE